MVQEQWLKLPLYSGVSHEINVVGTKTTEDRSSLYLFYGVDCLIKLISNCAKSATKFLEILSGELRFLRDAWIRTES